MSIRSLIPSLALLIASGALVGQEAAYQPKPDPSLQFHYKRFYRGDNEKIVDEAWGRHQWWLQRMGGELGADFYQHYIGEAEKERALNPMLFPRPGVQVPAAAMTPGPSWTSIGPTTAAFASNGVTLNIVDSGRGRVILPHPTDPDTVYFLNAGGGLWKTTNFTSSSTTWTATTDSVGSTSGGSAAFGKVPTTLYYGAGDPFDSGVGGFVVKSTDSAASWGTAVFLTGATVVYEIKVDTSGASDIVLVGTNAGLFRSTDGGATFNPAGAAQFSNKSVWTIVQTSAGWLASAEDSTGAGSLFISTDHGATWSAITNAGSVYSGAGRSTLAVGAPGDATVYCFAANTKDAVQLDLFKSTNGGQTWVAQAINSKVPTGHNSHQGTMNLMGGQAFYNHMIVVDPTDASRNTVILGGQLASARTTDGGSTWTLLTDWLPTADGVTLPYSHADHHCAAITNIGGTKRIFYGNDGGITVSLDNGATFDDKKNNGLASHLIYALAVNPNLAGSALVGLQDNGTRSRVLSPLGTVYNQIKGGDGFGVGWAPASGNTLCSYVYNRISRSTANPPLMQSDWSSFVNGLPSGTGSSSTNYYFVTPIITPPQSADPSGNIFYTYGPSGMFKCDASGWAALGIDGLTSGRVVRAVSHGMGVCPSNGNIIGAAGNGGNVLISSDGGSTWTEHFLGSTGTDGQNIGWTGYNANVAWATDQILYVCSESVAAGAPAHVAKSIDGGATWTRKDSGLPDLPVTKIAVDPADSSHNTAYAATWLGVYRTTNGGTSWSKFGAGLPQVRVTDIYVAPNSSFVRVSTWGRGLWELITGPSVGLSLSAVTMLNGGTQSFTPTVVNGTGNLVTWSSLHGTVPAGSTASGTAQTYTAPATGTSDTVTVTTVDTPVSTDTANITLVAPASVSVTVSPATVEMMTGTGTQQFTSNVSPLTNTAVTWSGTGVSGSGLFSATGHGAGQYTVTATSQAAPTRSGTGTVTLVAASSVNVGVTPATPTMILGGTQQFTATVTGLSVANQGVTWTTSGGGSITPSGGLFTAGTVGSSFTITATNTFSGVTGTATVNVKTLDLDASGTTDLLDLLYFAKYYNTVNSTCDLDGSGGVVGDADLLILLAGL